MHKEDIELLTRASHEIDALRQRNAILSAKVEMIDLFATVLNTQPARQDQGASLDVVWEMRRRAAEMQEADSAEKGCAATMTRAD